MPSSKHLKSKSKIELKGIRRDVLQQKSGRVKKGDNKDVHHSNGINSSRTTVLSRSKNRGKKEKSRLKGSTRKKRS